MASSARCGVWFLLLAGLVGSGIADLSAGAASHERSLGDKALIEGKLDIAMKHYEAAVKMNPTDHVNLYKRATALHIDKKYSAALRDLAEVLKIKPDYTQALDKRAKIYSAEGKFELARKDYEALRALRPQDGELPKKIHELHVAEQMQDAGKRLMEQQNWGGARDHLNKALDVASDSVDLLLARAECHMRIGDNENVLADTGKALKVDKKSMVSLTMRGDAYYRMNEFELAQRHFREGLRLDPEHSGCKEGYRRIKKMDNVAKAADGEAAGGKWQDALESYEKGTTVDPTHDQFVAKMHLGRCRMLHNLKKFQDAIAACSKVMDTPEDRHDREERIKTLLQRADAYLELEDWAEAVRDCERALNLHKDNHEAQKKHKEANARLKQSKMKDYYKILDIPRNADDRTIKKAYKKRALTMHPDKVCGANQCPSKEEQDRANNKFHEVAEAMEVLSDPEKRAKFDRGEDPINEQNNQQRGHPFGGGGFPGHGQGGFSFHFG